MEIYIQKAPCKRDSPQKTSVLYEKEEVIRDFLSSVLKRNTFENSWSLNFLLICLDDVSPSLNFSGAILLILLWAGFWGRGAGESKERRGDFEKGSEDFQDKLLSLQPFANPKELWDYLSAN